jgi:hypothetical protein
MDLDKLYALDEEAANDGKWFITKQGLDVKVAKIGNPSFVAEVVRLQKPHIVRLRSNMDNTAIINEITTKAMAKAVLIDWKAESNGVPVPYTPELGLQYMLKFPDFREDVSDLSVSRENFRPEEIAEK